MGVATIAANIGRRRIPTGGSTTIHTTVAAVARIQERLRVLLHHDGRLGTFGQLYSKMRSPTACSSRRSRAEVVTAAIHPNAAVQLYRTGKVHLVKLYSALSFLSTTTLENSSLELIKCDHFCQQQHKCRLEKMKIIPSRTCRVAKFVLSSRAAYECTVFPQNYFPLRSSHKFCYSVKL